MDELGRVRAWILDPNLTSEPGHTIDNIKPDTEPNWSPAIMVRGHPQSGVGEEFRNIMLAWLCIN